MNIGKIDIRRTPLIVAEIGNNHEGNFELAVELVELAALSGANAVKFQLINPELFVGRDQIERFSQLQEFQLRHDQYCELAREAKKRDLAFLVTAFDVESVNFLDEIVDAFKIASLDITFVQLIEAVARTNKPIVLSTGASELTEVLSAIQVIKGVREDWRENCVLLQCTSLYPTEAGDANLSVIDALSKIAEFVGFSDHTLGIDAAVGATFKGAKVIEKHFTKSKNFSPFRDHKISLEPHEFADMVQKIKYAVRLMGSQEKAVLLPEREVQQSARRSLAAKNDIKKGEALSVENILWLRPGGDVEPSMESKILGRQVKRTLKARELISEADLE